MRDSFGHCAALVRTADKDRYLAGLFAPAQHRTALFALYAFNIEIARVPEAVREPLSGELRLQWWADALTGQGRGDVAANPVSDAMLQTLARYALSPELLRDLIEARRFDIYDAPMATLDELETYADRVSGNLIRAAVHILAAGQERDAGPLVLHVGRAYAIAGLLKAFPLHAARGRLYVPVELLRRHG